MKKRSWFKRSSMVLTAFVSMAAPVGKASFSNTSKHTKPCKKSKSSLTTEASDGNAVSRQNFGYKPRGPVPRHEPTKRAHRSPTEVVRRALPAVDLCCAIAEKSIEEVRRALPVRPPQEEIRRALPAKGYAWKKEINTTVFWIGEKPTEGNPTPNHSSSWDEKWTKHYGGYDNPDPDARKGFLPAGFTPKQNPFYVALPYNDIAADGHKEDASKIIPWFKKAFTSKWKSVCKGRWIAIRKGDRVCYAQWEDAGPFTTTDSDYVFGDARPKPNANHGAGLDVSPAVRDFLGLDGQDSTDWKFVEFEDIPHGPWAEHGENNHFVLNRKASEKKAVAMSTPPESTGTGRNVRSSSKARIVQG